MASQNGAPDIKLLFGVSGNSSLSSGSGQEIKKQLDEIIRQINANPMQIDIKLSQRSLKLITDQISSLKDAINDATDDGGSKEDGKTTAAKKWADALTRVVNLYGQAVNLQKQAHAAGASSAEDALGSAASNLSAWVTELQRAHSSGDAIPEGFEEKFSQLRLSISAARTELSLFNRNTNTALNNRSIKAYNTAMQQLDRQTKIVTDDLKRFGDAGKTAGGSEHYKKLEGYSAKLADLQKRLRNGELSQNQFNRELEQIKKEAREAAAALEPLQSAIDGAADAALKASQTSFGAQLSNAFSGQMERISTSLSSRLLGFAGIMRGISVVKDVLKTAIDLEEQFAEYRIVTQATAQEASSFADNIAQTAQEVSTSIEDLVSATITYSRLGYDAEESSVLARLTGMLERVGSIDTQPAEDAVTSILKAFSKEIDVSNAESVMDRLVAVGNGFPISVEQIAAGMTNASSALAAAGNRFDESVALLTAANTTIQNAAKSSTGLRTIAARLRNTKAELDDLGEEMTTAKYEEIIQMLSDYKISLMDVNGEYRSTYDVMKDISGIWDEMTSMEQAAMATEIAGVRQQAVFYSLIEQFGEAEEAMKVMEDSAGSLTDAYAIYEETTSAHLATLGAAWEKLSSDVTDSGFMKGVIDFATSLVNVADGLAKVNALLPTLITLIGVVQGLRLLTTMIQMQSKMKSMLPLLISNKVGTEALKNSVKNLTIQEQTLLTAMIRRMAAEGKLEQKDAEAIIANYGLAASENAVEKGAVGVNMAFQTLMLSNPIGWIATIVGLIISVVPAIVGIKNALDDTHKTNEEIKDDLSTINTDISQTVSSFQQLKKSADEIIPKFAELSNGVDKFGNNISLTDEEYEEYIDLSNRMAELFPEIDAGIDSNGNHILALDRNAADLTETLYGLVEAQREVANTEIAANRDQILLDRQNYSDNYADEIDKLKHRKKIAQANLERFSKFVDEYERKIANGEAVGVGDTRNYKNNKASVARWEAEIDKIDAIIESKWQERTATIRSINQDLARAYSAWLQTQDEFLNAGDVVQNVALSSLNNIDWSQFDSTDDAEAWIISNIIDPILNMQPEVQEAIELVSDTFTKSKMGAASIDELKRSIASAGDLAKKYGIDLHDIYSAIGIDVGHIDDMFDELVNSISGSPDEVESFLSTLSYSELETAFNMIQSNGVMTIDELKNALSDAKVEAQDLADALDMEELFKKLGDYTKNIDKVLSAMKKLREGTALSRSELIKLAEQYPEMLKQSNLFTDGSIAGQQKLLQVVLDCLEKEYDAEIDTNIARLQSSLDATKKQIQAQLDAAKITISLSDLLSDLYASDAAAFWAAQNPDGDLQTYITKYNALSQIWNSGSADKIQELQNQIDNLEALKGLNLEELYGSNSSGSSGSSSGNSSNSDSWIKQQYNYHKHLVEMDKETTAQFLKWLNSAYKQAYAEGVITLDEYYKYEEEVYKGVQKLAENAKSAMDDVIQYRIKILKEQNSKEKSDLKDRIDAIKDFYDKQKEMLQSQYDEEKYLEEQAEKRKSVTDIAAQLEQISRDTSAYGEKRRKELEEELAAAKQELNSFEREHALDAMTNELDRMQEEQTAAIQAQIDAIDDVVNDPTALYNIALNDIKNNTAQLYQEFLEYNRTHGDGTDTAVIKMWNEAVKALAEYKAYYGTNYGGYTLSGYASGTSFATRGLHRVNETGAEVLFTSSDGRAYRLFSGGEKVLSAEASDFLYRFATEGGKLGGSISDIRRSMFGNTGTDGMVVNGGDIIINGNTDRQTVSQIRRAQKEGMDNLLRELLHLSRQ